MQQMWMQTDADSKQMILTLLDGEGSEDIVEGHKNERKMERMAAVT